MSWQRANIQAALTYVMERIATGADDARTRAVYEGLLEVLEPNRRTIRLQREAALSATGAVTVPTLRDRRTTPERRAHTERRRINLGSPSGIERRTRGERRSGKDRRRGH